MTIIQRATHKPFLSSKNESPFLVIAMLLAFLFYGCSQYRQEGFWNSYGYSEYSLSENSFEVTYQGFEGMRPHKAKEYVIRRCCEVAVEHGFQYFRVVEKKDNTASEVNVTYSSSSEESDDVLIKNKPAKKMNLMETQVKKLITIPSITLSIECYKEKPESEEAIDALYFLSHNKLD